MFQLVATAERLIAVVERVAVANEELIVLARNEREIGDEIENQPGPAFCPHCTALDPKVEIRADGQGRLSTFAAKATCGSCHKDFYVIAEGWLTAPDLETVEQMQEAREAD